MKKNKCLYWGGLGGGVGGGRLAETAVSGSPSVT